MTTVQIWVAGEHYVLDRDEWEELTESVDGPVHARDDEELLELLDEITEPESTD